MGASGQSDSIAGSGKGSPTCLNRDMAVETELAPWRAGEATPKGKAVSQGKDSQAGWEEQRAGGGARDIVGPSVG